jgi:hypothetical protein
MHISLGVRTEAFRVDRFVNARGRKTVTISTAPQAGVYNESDLIFATNPKRRGGEWIIRDQFSHRHPAWSPAGGFPRTYSKGNPPYILVFRIGDTFHVRFATARVIASLAGTVPKPMLSEPKGIASTSVALLRRFKIHSKTLLEAFDEESDALPSDAFDPQSVEDGRRRIFAAVHIRQGQSTFRRRLMKAYGAKCAITGMRTVWVLEAAHITAYMGAKTNTVTNGLLLRADLHTLFDLGLISIEPNERKVKVSKQLAGSTYAKLDGKKLLMPKTPAAWPSAAALREHFSQFQP